MANKSKKLNRIITETSRASEYFDSKELQAQTGQHKENFATVILKELLDNALDACEAIGRRPEIMIDINPDTDKFTMSIHDNGKGISSDIVEKILNFNTRTSDKSIYRTPTRGSQGNALKTVLGIPYALGSDAPILIEGQGIKHTIHIGINPAGKVWIEHNKDPIKTHTGTKIEATLPIEGQRFNPGYWIRAFSIFNPHAMIKMEIMKNENKLAKSLFQKEENSHFCHSLTDKIGKFLPTDLPSPHWYDTVSLTRLIYSFIGSGEGEMTLRNFIKSQFRGLASGKKLKIISEEMGKISRLSDFENNPDLIKYLLSVMHDHTKEPSSSILGCVGEELFKKRFEEWYGVKRSWYKKISGNIDGIPYVFEAFLAETKEPGDLFTGVNYSQTFEDPLAETYLHHKKIEEQGIKSFLSQAHVFKWGWHDSDINTAIAIHLICPVLEFLDRGKTRLKIKNKMKEDIAKVLWSVSKTIYKEEEQRKKNALKAEKAKEKRESQENKPKYSLKTIVFHVMKEAVERATGNGDYPVSQRNLYYQVRPLVQDFTHAELTYSNFGNILTQYRQQIGEIKGLYFDPRGVLYEPHTGKSLLLGTREVAQYEFPSYLYNKILYIEKKGLFPILQKAKIADFYDMAIVAGEGYATEAIRNLFERADTNEDYQLFVLHDADPAGYNIARTLQEETARMPGYSVEVIDLGLKLEEAIQMGLQTEEFTRKKALPTELYLNDTELEYFEGEVIGYKDNKKGQYIPTQWKCERVELNAMSAPEFIEYIELKLYVNGATDKVIPPKEKLNNKAKEIFDSQIREEVNEALFDIFEEVIEKKLKELNEKFEYDNALQWIEEKFEEDKTTSWKQALTNSVEHEIEEIPDFKEELKRKAGDFLQEVA